MSNNEARQPSERDINLELEATKKLLELAKGKLFTAIWTITELELIIQLDREKLKELTDLLDSSANKNVSD